MQKSIIDEIHEESNEIKEYCTELENILIKWCEEDEEINNLVNLYFDNFEHFEIDSSFKTAMRHGLENIVENSLIPFIYSIDNKRDLYKSCFYNKIEVLIIFLKRYFYHEKCISFSNSNLKFYFNKKFSHYFYKNHYCGIKLKIPHTKDPYEYIDVDVTEREYKSEEDFQKSKCIKTLDELNTFLERYGKKQEKVEKLNLKKNTEPLEEEERDLDRYPGMLYMENDT